MSVCLSENYAPVSYYAASSGNFLPTFRNNPSVLSSGFNLIPEDRLSRNVGKKNYHYSLRNDPEERSSQLLRGGSLKSRISVCLAVRPSVCACHKSPNFINTSLKYFCAILKMTTECDVPSILVCINSLLLMHYLEYRIRYLLCLSLSYGNCNKRQLLHNTHTQENPQKT